MTRHASDADAAVVWATLPAALRDALDEAQAAMGMPQGSALVVPALRTYMVIYAAHLLAAQMTELSASDAFAAALEMLGVEDDSDRNTRPSDSVARTLRGWRRAAEMAFHASTDVAA
jgi:hypothetical protein